MIRLLFILLFCAGCATPGPHFRDVAATRIAVDGSVFDIRVRGHLAEAVRVNPRYAPRLGAVGRDAALAMHRASGCDVTAVLGDAALVLGVLECRVRHPRPLWPPGSARS